MKLQKVVEIVKIKQITKVREDYAGFVIRSPQDAARILKKEIGDEDREVFMVLALNTKNQLRAIHRCHIGSINASIVSPREVFKVAILNNATSIIVGHNHPSYDTKESREDVDVTHRLDESGKLLGIELLDHIIVAPNSFNSLKQKGIF